MQDREMARQDSGVQQGARRDFLNRLGKASLGIPATVMLMSVTEKQASATGGSMSGGMTSGSTPVQTTTLPGGGGGSNASSSGSGDNCDVVARLTGDSCGSSN